MRRGSLAQGLHVPVYRACPFLSHTFRSFGPVWWGPHFLMLGCQTGDQACQNDDLDWGSKKLLTPFIGLLGYRQHIAGRRQLSLGRWYGRGEWVVSLCKAGDSLFCLLCWGLSDRHWPCLSLVTFPRLARKYQENFTFYYKCHWALDTKSSL